MRRSLSIALMLLFWLGPLAAALPGGGDSRLPACCRRHGQHHCGMLELESAQLAASGRAAFAAPRHCPFFPRTVAPLNGSTWAPAKAAARIDLAVLSAPASPFRCGAAPAMPVSSHEGRGPPDTSLL